MSTLQVEAEQRLVPAVDRAVSILDFVADARGTLGVSEIARGLQLPKSSVHGLCETLVALNLLRSVTGGYAPGPRALRWASSFLGRSTLTAEFQNLVADEPVLAAYTTTLSILEKDNVVYLACRNSDKPLGFTFQVGQHLPSVFTATGKAMLAALSPDERAARLPHRWPRALTANSVADIAAFEAQASNWQELGYAVDEEEVREGMVCIGATIVDERARPVAGIAASLTTTEARPDVRAEIGRVITKAAGYLSRLSGLGAAL